MSKSRGYKNTYDTGEKVGGFHGARAVMLGAIKLRRKVRALERGGQAEVESEKYFNKLKSAVNDPQANAFEQRNAKASVQLAQRYAQQRKQGIGSRNQDKLSRLGRGGELFSKGR